MTSMKFLILQIVFLVGYFPGKSNAGLTQQTKQEDPAVTRLREYLRFKSAQPTPEEGYQQCIAWLREEAEDIGLDFHFLKMDDPAEFATWMTWNGTNPSLKSVLLNSHMDVVNADPSKWTHPPYDAYKDENGNIIGRGASDMKSATVAELEAIRRLKNSGFQPLRTVHLTILPDEEPGGKKGMEPFVKTDHFRNLNVGVDIDEGFVVDSETLVVVSYAEKALWRFNITARGEASHASNLPQYTAGQRLQVVIDKLMEYRQSEYRKLENSNLTLEHVTTINLVRMGGGIGDNTIPNELWASFDMRIVVGPGWNFTDVENMLLNITQEARLGSSPNEVELNYILKSMESGVTPIDDSNVWWTELQKTCDELNITCIPQVFTAATDGRYVRELGIPVFGFNPFPSTPVTAHQDNEFINEVQFLRGIDRYMTVIQNFAMFPENLHP